MAYQISKFGDAGYLSPSNVVSEVSNHYGQRDVGGTNGVIKTEGGYNELTFHIDREVLENESFKLTTIPRMPARSKVDQVLVKVEGGFTLAGTTPIVRIGTAGSVGTNGFELSKAQVEGDGIYDVTDELKGTWAGTSELKAATEVGIDLSGEGAAISGDGKLKVVVRYFHV